MNTNQAGEGSISDAICPAHDRRTPLHVSNAIDPMNWISLSAPHHADQPTPTPTRIPLANFQRAADSNHYQHSMARTHIVASIALLLGITTALLASQSTAHNIHNATRRLASSPGNIAACYSPMHSPFYPFGREALQMERFQDSIDADFALMAKHITHVRTFYSQFFGINIAEVAARHGLKVYLGVFMTSEAWGTTEIDAAVEAATKYPDTVEAILVGNENLFKGVGADAILGVVNQIRARVGNTNVKFGTVQRITEYMDAAYDGQTKVLEANLDILGVNIYPFFDPNFDVTKPTELTNTLWNNMANKYPVSKMRLTETGFPTAGPASDSAPSVFPNLEASYAYYEALRQWVPAGAEATPKFWFAMFDRRPDDNTMGVEFEKHFGFYTHNRQQKRDGYPLTQTDAAPPTPTLAPEPTVGPVPMPEPILTSAPTAGPDPEPAPTEPITVTPTVNPIKQVEIPTPAPTSMTSSPDSGANTNPTPAQTSNGEDVEPLPTPASTWTDEVPTPAATWMDEQPTPVSTWTDEQPTPAVTWNDEQPTPAATWTNNPTPAMTVNRQPTPAPSSVRDPSVGADSSVASDAAPASGGLTDTNTNAPVKQNDSMDANAKESNLATRPSSLLGLVAASLLATLYVL